MNQAIAPQAVYEELDLGGARGGMAGARRPPLEVSVARPLAEADLQALLQPPLVSAQAPVVKSIRHSHHRLAQLLAEGKPGTEIALVTGYSQSYLSTIQGDPAFEELVSYYAEQRTTIFIDAQERLKALGLDATEKLHERLHSPEEIWTKKDLMDVIKLGLPAETGSGQKLAIKSPEGTGGGFSLEVKFVSASGPSGQPSGPTIETGFTDITPKP